jgi:flagellum-specific ATP synthase
VSKPWPDDEAWVAAVAEVQWFRLYGRITEAVGVTVESIGPRVHLGELCTISSEKGTCLAEVVGFRERRVILVPLDKPVAVVPGAEVRAAGRRLGVACGTHLLGRVLDGLGRPLDGLGPLPTGEFRELDASPPHPLVRMPIARPLYTGVRVIDGLLTVGAGQRIGIFAGSGVGKSTLLAMIARNTEADVNVIAFIGERGREVREFIDGSLGDSLSRTVVVVSTSDQPPLLRLKAALVATTIAEYFRDQGLTVNLMMDSLTRFAMAQREIGLAAGEPPTTRGYPPSVFSLLPRLLERAGCGAKGAVTGFYTVLVEGDDNVSDPIADAVRGILDGHVVLSRTLAGEGHFPAVDVLASLSRLFPTLANPAQQQAAQRVRRWLQCYRDAEDLIRIGAYRPGSDPELDMAVTKLPKIREYLMQRPDERTRWQESLQALLELAEVAE